MPLSKTLVQVSESSLKYIDGHNMLPEGSYIIWDTSEIIIPENTNLYTTLEAVTLMDHNDTARLIGCCGVSELDKLNQICPRCEEEVAVISSDCWLPHFVAFDIEKVYTKM